MLLYTGFLWFFDRITKIIALSKCCQEEYMFNTYLSCVTVFNQGSSLSMLEGHTIIEQIIFLISPIFAILFLYYFFMKQFPFASSLITAGALGNLYDRIHYEGVIDFIFLHFTKYNFPIFNSADVFICLGAIILFINIYKYE